MPITYTSGWVIVQGDYSGYDNIFELIFNESASNSWGIESQQRNYMQLSPASGIQFGEASQSSVTAAVSKNENVRIVNKPIKCVGNSSYQTALTIGEYDDVKDLTKNGCNIEFYNNAPSYFASINITDSYSSFNCYDSKIMTYGSETYSNLNWMNFNGPVEIIDSVFCGEPGQLTANIWFKGDTGILRRIKLTGGYFGLVLSIGSPVYEDIICNDNEHGFGAFSGGTATGITAKNARNASGKAICTYDFLSAGYTFNFLNSVIDNSKVEYLYPSDTGLEILEQFTVDIKCVDADGDPVENVRVRAWDNTQDPETDTPKFNVLTQSDGTIEQQVITVSRNVYNNAYTSFNPFTFYLEKDGLKEKNVITEVTGAVDWIFSMEVFWLPEAQSTVIAVKTDTSDPDIDVSLDEYNIAVDVFND